MYRSRLQRVEEKKNVKKAIWLIVISMAVLGISIVWGVPLLIKLAIFIGELNSSKTPIDRTDIIPPAPPQMNLSYDATNSAMQVITGWTEPGAKVFLTQNETSIASVLAKDDGSFQFNGVRLDEGANEFVAVAMDLGGNKSLPSTVMTIKYTNQTPKLEVTAPVDGQNISGGEGKIEVKGKTDPGNRITINGRVIIISADGSFTTKYGLNSGENQLTIIASDRVGNKTELVLSVNYSP